MVLTRIFSLFMSHLDSEAKNLLADYLKKNNQASYLIQDYLNKELTSVKTIDSLETIDIFAHFSGLELVSKEDGGSLEEFQLVVIEIEDLNSYNRCGRRVLKQVLSPELLSFYNQKTGLKETVHLNNLSAHFEVI